MIPFNKASLVGNELNYMQTAVTNGHISGNGPFTSEAENRLREITGAQSVLLTTNCTHALELAARAMKLGVGDEVIVPSYTFVSTASAIASTGAKPVFVDVLPSTLNLDPVQVANAITPATRAVFTVHYAGIAEGIDQLQKLCSSSNLLLLEDNAHGLGGKYGGKPLGTFGQLSTLSFHETKNITCGEGGALTLNDDQFKGPAEILREKGTDRARFLRGQVDKYTWVDVGSSWVPSDILAGYLLGQLEHFSTIQAKRAKIWSAYHNQLLLWGQSNGFRTPIIPSLADHPSHLYYLHAPDLETRTRFIEHLRKNEIMAVFHYQALNVSSVGQQFGGRVGACPVSESAADTLVRLPLYSSLSDSEVERVIEAIMNFDA